MRIRLLRVAAWPILDVVLVLPGVREPRTDLEESLKAWRECECISGDILGVMHIGSERLLGPL